MYVRKMREISVLELDKYIIIDTHGGEEDILGIVFALKLAQRYDKIVVGITCVNGRRNVDQAAHDALIAQQIAQTKVPVYKGSKQSLLLRNDYPVCHDLQNHSEQLDRISVLPEKLPLVQRQYAPIFIAQQIKKYGEELCIISFGPLTNLALAFHRNQHLKVISSVRINGGAISGVGNVINSSGSEGNLCYDPHAGSIIVSNFNNVYINPIEMTLAISFQNLFQKLRKKGQLDNSSKLNQILNIILSKKYVLCGPLLTLAPAFLRQTVKKVYSVYSQIINQGNNIVGLFAANWLRLDVKQNEQIPNVKIYSDFDIDQIEKIVKEALLA